MLAGVIVTHARLAEALREAVANIAGDVTQLETVSNEGLSQPQIAARVRAAVGSSGDDGCVVFVDLSGGSCATGCLEGLRGLPRVRVLSGVNLPMLVDFVLRRRDLDLDAMVARLLHRGQASVQELKA